MIQQLITLFWIIAKLMGVLLPLFVCVAYMTFAERKVIAYMQNRIGPNRTGFKGLAQPLADTLKLITKELIIPHSASPYLFLLAPLVTLTFSLTAWAIIPVTKNWFFAQVDGGLLYLLAISSLGVYGVVIAGWASNSKYAFLGSVRSVAQMLSYEIALGFVFAGVLLLSESMRLVDIVLKQSGGINHWFFIPLFTLFIIYWIAVLAETNRAPFDVAEGESEIVAGFHVEYSGIGFALFFLAEYANMILASVVSVLLFWGGWLSPFENIPVLNTLFSSVPPAFWLIIKSAFFMFFYFWVRATFPRFRYDRIMRLGWKFLIPFALVWIVLVAGISLWQSGYN